jgi:uncharacterized protein YjbJ (UPF0337 family)
MVREAKSHAAGGDGKVSRYPLSDGRLAATLRKCAARPTAPNRSPHAVSTGLRRTFEEMQMNRDQVKGRAHEVAGKAKKAAGRATRSPMMEAKGLAKEARGKVQKNVGDMRARNARNDKSY